MHNPVDQELCHIYDMDDFLNVNSVSENFLMILFKHSILLNCF